MAVRPIAMAVSLGAILYSHSGASAQTPEGVQLDLLENNLREHVRVLSSEIGERNMGRYDRLQEACRYIDKILNQYNYSVRLQSFVVDGKEVSNVIVARPGKRAPEETILVGAHYDTVEDTPGADDNASGVAGVLELARLFSGYSPQKTLKFAAFVNEEAPYFLTGRMGSQHYVRQAKERREKIVAMMSLEMIGYYSDRNQSQLYPAGLRYFYPEEGNFIGVVGHLKYFGLYRKIRNALRKHSKVPVESLAGVDWIHGVGLSDHASFWREGYPAVMITDTAFYRNPHYHSSTDTFETLDYRRMAEVVKGLYHTLIALDQ